MIEAFSLVWFAVAFGIGAIGPAGMAWFARRRELADFPHARIAR